MSLRNKNSNITPFESLDFEEKYDYKKIGSIIEAMDFIRREANKTGDEDISLIINSAFNLCFSAYYLALRRLEDNRT